jgi:hypothetical protein
MGRKKKVEIAGKRQITSYTKERLEQLTESQLEAKEIEIRSGHLKDNMFCHYGYDHTVSANTTDNVARKSQVPVHDDLKVAFRKLNVHLAVICEEINPDDIPDIDNLPELDPDPDMTEEDQDPLAVKLSRFSVSAFKIVGNGENEGVVLTGQKRLSTLEFVKLETPVTRWQGDYPYVNELHVAIFNLVEEIEQYMQGKQAPQRQTEMDFGNEADDDAELGNDLY